MIPKLQEIESQCAICFFFNGGYPMLSPNPTIPHLCHRQVVSRCIAPGTKPQVTADGWEFKPPQVVSCANGSQGPTYFAATKIGKQ